jgi:hypothetical protein
MSKGEPPNDGKRINRDENKKHEKPKAKRPNDQTANKEVIATKSTQTGL